MDTALETSRGAPLTDDEPLIVYFSSVSGNTQKFVDKVDAASLRLPLRTGEETIHMDRPYVLCVPTYGRPRSGGAIPPQVMKFLQVPQNRELMLGVMGAGNTNFGEHFCIAADKIAVKCRVPVLYKFELMGTSDDVARVNEGLKAFWKHNSPLAT
ncbi:MULTISPECIES: class Ib ribonucleoside-diphosphate reductase assembly flavoprotein NrdI [Kocuria]|uniref:class Ib ribonucleoside-diphosphate reductase assembly flavoprotein NrdI n=1 Tax=Kocuria TaxID=57493 RepID=UPI0006616914|nr:MULTISPECIES: class Ib ribonucleoside-diphosphate reductase assembly flavoprotein NrdI [Kocuria]MCT1367460.1 class Ib ribonucleoside-diphosphate reductase assembly flavoprotein NrdI [Rothia sp. p3-SID1597]RUQ22538.1 class Ib ribonucleoside-diphosphate reductase assembly flavoprotein NrdI [Kocuria sp. HSID16901]